MRTLAYHEGIPGHHFQISIAQEISGLPFFRRVLPFTAYVEGWALYAERLAWELGFEKDPLDNLGRLRDEMMRAVRLVVDTGIHYKHWTTGPSSPSPPLPISLGPIQGWWLSSARCRRGRIPKCTW